MPYINRYFNYQYFISCLIINFFFFFYFISFNFIFPKAQTDVNWNECSLTKYGHFLGTSSKSQYKKNPEQINVSSRRKHYIMKRNKENSIRKTLTDSDWMKHRISSQVFAQKRITKR